MIVTLYDADFTEIETVRSEPVEYDMDTEVTVELDLVPPDD